MPSNTQGPENTTTVVPRIIQATRNAQHLLVEAELLDEEDQDDELEQASEELDPPARDQEDFDDSELSLESEISRDPFDEERELGARRLWQLPYRARPLVRFWIDATFKVHRLSRRRSAMSDCQFDIARAIAEHIRTSEVSLVNPGDWQNIPVIRGEASLRALASGLLPAPNVEVWLKSLGSELKFFAVGLPNGDVITPRAILKHARKSKRATLAAALRAGSDLPGTPTVGGEAWTRADWRALDKNERQNRERGDLT